MRHPSSKRNDAGGTPAGSASLRRSLETPHLRAGASGERPDPLGRLRLRLGKPLPGGVKVARRFVKPHGVGASPTLAAILIYDLRMRIYELHKTRCRPRARKS